MISLLIVGHSHIECLRSAFMARSERGDVTFVNIRSIQKSAETGQSIISLLKAEISGFNPDAVCLCIGGNTHNLIGLLENPVPFSVGEEISGSVPAPDKNRVFIPHALMRDYFDININKNLISNIYGLFPNAVKMYLNPPPPIPDFEHIKQYPGVFKDKISYGASPKELRIELYNIQSNALRSVAKQERAIFVEVESSVINDEGFLLPAYFNQDATHGNTAYGDIMLNQIINLAEKHL